MSSVVSNMYLIKKWLSIFILAIFASFKALSYETSQPTRIFFLGSGSSESPWTELVSQGVRKNLEQSTPPYVFYTDHLDSGRFDEVGQYNVMYRYLKNKFNNKTPDIFISAGPAASHFSMEHPDLFSNSTRILIQPKPHDVNGIDGAVIIDTEIDYSSMITEAIRLSNPVTFFIVGDTNKPSDLHRLKSITQELEQRGIIYKSLENKNLTSLLKEVSEIPSNNAVFYTPIYREHEGKGLPPVFVLKELHKVADVPIFATSVTELGFGSVGGYLHSPTELGMMAGEAVLDIIKGKPVGFSHNGFEFVYDWNEIIRWGYQSKISDKAQVLNRPPSLWEEHKKEAIILTAFLLVLVVLLIILTIYNRKLKAVKNALSKERKLLEKKVDERTKELSVLYQEAEKIARVDELTNISNRRAFFELGELIHNQTQRTSNNYTVVMLDIDEFKKINDTYGHAAGDSVIKNVAKALISISRKSDVVARIGGEEFAVILTNGTRQQSIEMAERVRSKIEKLRIQFGQYIIYTTVSVGVAEYQAEEISVGSVLAKADKALYQAKETGKNKVVF
ncbi:diguanylate cyclase [Vibrio algarum]|uniref:diguanylate cyclase n=1 Tax=Vibrio algarum TaxID=3020714 RepID=A0ABT4YM71_9VIBR|nr:diguanylate cyclase [Vibrio sp. KJ40-1]MDB1122647.1 diguanylate cyclase [Vibrio sp. KJ40-1]